MTLAHDNFPWYSILESPENGQDGCMGIVEEDEAEVSMGGFGALMGKGTSSYRIA